MAIPHSIIRLWEPHNVEYVRMELHHHGRLLLIPYTRELRLVVIHPLPGEVPNGDPGPQS